MLEHDRSVTTHSNATWDVESLRHAIGALYAISPETLAIRVDEIRCELAEPLARVQGEIPDDQFDVLLDRMALQRFLEERRPVEFSR
jgi:hypothetical protein